MISSKNQSPSLRRRYITLTVLLGLFVVLIVEYSHHNLATTKQSVTTSYKAILENQHDVQEARDVLLSIQENIDLFLLDPLNHDLSEQVDLLTSRAKTRLHEVASTRKNIDTVAIKSVTDTIKLLDKLNEQVKQLIAHRLDPNKQYPAMTINANVMELQQDSIKSSFEILINEIESGDLEPESAEVYPLLLKSYSVWINAISQTRIYMTNRLASFSTEILSDQAASLQDIKKIFVANVERLAELYSNEDSFEGPDTIRKIKNTLKEWEEHWIKMRIISESDEWRLDALIMKTKILPLLHAINLHIDNLYGALNNERVIIDNMLRQSNDDFSNLQFLIIVMFLMFIVLMLLSMEWLVFNPIGRVTQALRSRAFDIELPRIESANTREVGSLIEAFKEMDEEVSRRQHALEHQAMHDHLTGLPNRFMLHQRIDYQLLSAERQQKPFVLFLMDLDYFKDINDTLGHSAGDNLLIQVSIRIADLIRKSDTLARLGGDEFAILLPDTDIENSEALAKKILTAMHQPFTVAEQSVTVGISIGIVSYPDDGDDGLILLQHADMAMYAAKRQRIGLFRYESEEDFYSKERLSLFNEVRAALDNEQFEVYFQPKFTAESNSVCGAEVLLRWNHENFGFVSPEKIIDAAEHIGIIHELTLWIMEQGIRQCVQWHESGHRLALSVNLSVRDLSNPELCRKVCGLLEQYQLDYHYLTLEITESVMMENLALSIDALEKLHEKGINISIDDFGTGFSSLAYIKKLPVSEIKIDKSFLLDVYENASNKTIVESTINLGHNLGLRVVAEGVENETILQLVKTLDCDQMQGFHLGKPMQADAFIRMIDMLSR